MDKMNENEVLRIRKSRGLTPLLALLALLMAFSSAYLLYVYFTQNLKQPFETLFLVVGGISSVYFTVCFFNLLYQTISPKNALLISEDGFLELINGGTGVGFVSWANVTRVEMLGKDKPYIGIGLLSSENVTEDSPEKLISLIESRAEKGLPELMIRPFEIGVPLDEVFSSLRDFRNRYYRNIDSGDTNVIDSVVKMRELNMPEMSEFNKIFKEKEGSVLKESEESESVIFAEETETVSNTVRSEDNSKTGDISSEKKQAETKKSIDELLAELSDTIGKKKSENANNTDKTISDGIDELIKLLKDKK